MGIWVIVLNSRELYVLMSYFLIELSNKLYEFNIALFSIVLTI